MYPNSPRDYNSKNELLKYRRELYDHKDYWNKEGDSYLATQLFYGAMTMQGVGVLLIAMRYDWIWLLALSMFAVVYTFVQATHNSYEAKRRYDNGKRLAAQIDALEEHMRAKGYMQ